MSQNKSVKEVPKLRDWLAHPPKTFEEERMMRVDMRLRDRYERRLARLRASPEPKRGVCPKCASVLIWKEGFLYSRGGKIQRYKCSDCGHRFQYGISPPPVVLQAEDQKV